MSNYSLLLIDPQVDFHPGGSLAIPGADDDSLRISTLILNNADKIDEMFVTLDTHNPEHIAHARFWTNKDGKEPSHFQQITHEDILNDIWLPKESSLREYCTYYLSKLEENGRFKLTIWPEHCLFNSPGHEVVDSIKFAISRWETLRNKRAIYITKGMNNLTEMYSAIKAEVPIADDPSTCTNIVFLMKLEESYKLVVCGQALTHCVNYTMRDILSHWTSLPVKRSTQDIILLIDGTSPVQGFIQAEKEFLQYLKEQGVQLQTCQSWEEVRS